MKILEGQSSGSNKARAAASDGKSKVTMKFCPRMKGYGDGMDDLEYEENVDNANEFEEYEDMGFKGEISDNSYDSEELRDLV
ncbi:hypothetical protein M0R45_008688 [Rubus argutus]|uniref:Uncharacterized protein n=1 Tax=Rubus argutus TaxID=59490 RepID=A0AAW1Y5S5_RUBAR